MKRFLLVLGLILSFPSWALNGYRAIYELSIRGVHAGEMNFELILTPRTYRIDAVSTPSAMAKLLGYNLIKEFAQGEIKDHQLLPQKYKREMIDNPKFTLQYQYELSNKKIEALLNDKKETLTYENIIPLDILSLVIQSLLDEEQKRLPSQYALLNEEKIRHYQVQALPNEKWQNEKGETLDIRVYQQINGNRKTLIYFAHSPLRLVKLHQIKDDESRFVLKLLDYQERK